MDQIIFLRNRDSLNGLLSENSEIGIILPERHSMDVISAGLALYLSLGASGKNVQIVSKTTPLVEHSNVFGVDKIRKNFDGKIKKLTIAVPYVEGEIEKVSYDKDEANKKLLVNFISEESGITFSENDVEYIRKGSVPSLIIALGITNQNEISEFVDAKAGVKFVLVNNAPVRDLQGDISYTDGAFSSLSEIIGKIITVHGLVMDQDIAQNLMDGVVSATNNFTSERTGSAAFEITGVVMRAGAKRKKEMPRMQQKSNLENLVRFDKRNDNRRDDRRHEQRKDNASRPQNFPNQDRPHAQSLVSTPPTLEVNEEVFDDFDQAPVTNIQLPQTQQISQKEEKKEKIPSDWFVPKIYKGDKTN